MANVDSTGTLRRADHPVRLTGSPNWHYASMRSAELSARGISVQLSVRGFLGGLADETPAGELARMRAVRDSHYDLAAAHRNAARRLERGQRVRARVDRVVRPVVRLSLRLGRAVSA